ncbi:tetratricopeptide (TPR) repeat protein [Deinobacterium chartae]|uniref:Tetratricopeptide (TPR) repeat protein n=1 Tax=Deinobacterium chartae TaxID=521158 RepID=A0A841HXD9_9DEIO|nr:tetratricopeptide repeat protein [Deinobacterium chartae]MBB6096909.1 tetratricopeptide (TPR) repeat protein [Deinobacterium chartae]
MKQVLIAVTLSLAALSPAAPALAQATTSVQSVQSEREAALKSDPPVVANPRWKALIASAEALVQSNPQNAAALRLRAQIYNDVKWWIKAEEAWRALEASGAELTAADRRAYATALQNLGYSALTRSNRDIEEALRYFRAASRIDPSFVEARYQEAQVLLETGRTAESRAVWQAILQQNPSDKRAQYFVGVTERLADYGPDAARNFAQGYAAYEAGDKRRAQTLFKASTTASANFVEGWRYYARTSFELGDMAGAVEGYSKVVGLEGNNNQNAYWLKYAQEAQRYGLEGVKAYRQGYSLYSAGDKRGAEAAFVRATQLSPQYQQAWAWLGRTRLELGNTAGAVAAYEQAVKLDPNDAAAAYALRRARAAQ